MIPHGIEAGSTGVVSLSHWTMGPNGKRVLYLWAPRWEVKVDSAMGIKDYSSTAKWTLVGLNHEGHVVASIPGGEVKAWVHAAEFPTNAECVDLGKVG